MVESARIERNLHTLAGVSGLLVGVLILTFAFVGTGAGVAFAPEILRGGSMASWIESVESQPLVWRFVTACATLGFGAMMVSAFAVYQLLGAERWEKYLSLCGYVVGVPTVINTFLSHYAVMYRITTTGLPVGASLEAQAEWSMVEWLVAGGRFGPVFVVVIGSGFLALAALRARLLPAWVCWWGLLCAAMAFLQLFSGFWHPLAYFSLGAGPLHMLWFSVVGVTLLLRRPTAG